MAEGILRELAPDKFEALSAGMDPQGETHPLAIKAMDEIGIDISGQKPEGIKKYLGTQKIRWLISVCDKANKSCPRIWPLLDENSRIHWPFDDPAEAEGNDEEKLVMFRRIRDEIKEKIQKWLSTLESN
jgi:arsenate reductase